MIMKFPFRYHWWRLAEIVFAALVPVVVAGASLEIVQTELLPGGQLRVRFTDSSPPLPYGLEMRASMEPQAAWEPMHGSLVTTLEPAQLEAIVPGGGWEGGFYRISVSPGAGLPLVVATDPPNGATGVATSLTHMRVSFDRPMAATASVRPDPNWGASFLTWSADRRMAEIHRLSAPLQMAANSSVSVTLNAEGHGFADHLGQQLAPYSFSFSLGAHPVEGPHVVWSHPSQGAKEVDPSIDTVEFRFSEPMIKSGGFSSSGWWPWSLSWSEDGRTAYVTRETAGKPIYGHSVRLSPLNFRSAAGVPLVADYDLRFKTADPDALRVGANPAKGFYWPYYLWIPPNLEAPVTLLVEPNNTGGVDDDLWIHEQSARSLVNWRSSFANRLGSPLLVPVFPRPANPPAPEPGGIYIHALDRYSLNGTWAGIHRIDLQILAMVEDALQRLRSEGHSVDDQVFMMGFSASGAFTSRFAILHPSRLKAAVAGSSGGWPTAPVGSWQGTPLRYPMGILDMHELTGAGFDLSAFQQLPLYIYVGGVDTNDAFDVRGMSETEKAQVRQFLNWPSDPVLASRWPLAQTIYQSVGSQAEFVVYPGVAHTITSEMFDDLLAFFRQHR